MKRQTLIFTLLLLLFFFLALVVRLYHLGIAPESLTWDEAALGYNSFSLLKTGADEYAQKLPLVLRSFDDYKPALYAYLTVPSIKLFGLTIFSVRLTSALAGSSLVFGVFLLALAITKNRLTSLFAALLVIVSPVLLLYSRIALEANLSLALFIFGTAFVFIAPYKHYLYGIGLFFLVLSMYAYHSPRYIVPVVILLSLLQTSDNKFNLKSKLTLILAAFIAILPVMYFTFSSQFNTRFSQTSLLTNHKNLFGFNAELNYLDFFRRTISQTYFYTLDVLGRYLGYFNPYQLFVNSQGHSLYHVDGLGIFNMFEFPFWVLGLITVLKTKRKYIPLIALLLIAPIPAAMTIDWFMPLRAILVWPLHLIVTAIGIQELLKHRSRVIVGLFLFGACTLWIYQSLLGFETVAIYQPYVHAGDYQYGFAQIVPYINANKNKYSQIIIGSPHAQPHIFFAFFSAYPPDKYQADTAWRRTDYTPRHNFDFGDYHFRSIYWPTDRKLSNTMFVGNVFELPDDQLNDSKNVESIKDFYAPDGSIDFRIVTTK